MTTTAIDAMARARRHPLTIDKPAMRFFEGGLLGNGGLGAVVMERPDAIVIALGHNAVWDRRVDERHGDEIGTFAEIFDRVQSIDPTFTRLDEDPWYAAYEKMTAENYRASYPRPFPCGRIVFGFDRRRTEVLGHAVEIADGLCQIRLLHDGEPLGVEVFVDQVADRVLLRTMNDGGKPAPAPFTRLRIIPETIPAEAAAKHPAELSAIPFPAFTIIETEDDALAFHQRLPALTNDGRAFRQTGEDQALRVTVRTSTALHHAERASVAGYPVPFAPLERALEAADPFMAVIQLDSGVLSAVPSAPASVLAASPVTWRKTWSRSEQVWIDFWSRSGVALDDEQLERTWYRNQYFLHCAVRAGRPCPGLWANWSMATIGTAWHGDYHMNYNCQQPFWGVFSSNHVDLHEPYVDLVDHLLPVSRTWAKDYYGLPGAYYPHSAYPTPMGIMPYPVPTWGWEICETPWTVQSLIWHYRYTQDRRFLADRAWEPLREAVVFLVAYIQRPAASGPDWRDEYLHIFPSVVPELYGLTPGLRHNADVLADLTLTRFVLNGFVEACAVLGRDTDDEDAALLAAVRDVLARLAPNPTADSSSGTVFVAVRGEDPEIVYNVPVPTMPAFPGEELGLGSDPDERSIAINSWRNQRNEGGNDLVFMNLQGARLGILDLDRFKRQIDYCLLPNGTCTDLGLQALGRYRDETDFDFMGGMGIWLENFALPAVINECLLQSWDGVLRLFPNWPLHVDARFTTLRAVGAFLVSAACANGEVTGVEIVSEAGGNLRLVNPWPGETVMVTRGNDTTHLDGIELTIPTTPNETLTLRRGTP